jgi:hypothetical protein
MAEEDDFVASIAKAQRGASDVAGMFGGPGRVAFEGNPRKMGPELEFDAHVQLFGLPGDRGEYEDVLNKVLRGEATIRYEEKTFTKDGDFIVAVCYLTPRQLPQARPDQDAGDAEAPVLPRRIP